MRVYFDVYDVPGHWIGWVQGRVKQELTLGVGQTVELPEIGGERRELCIEAILPSERAPDQPQHKLTPVTFTSAAEAKTFIEELERTGLFGFWPME